MKNTLYGQKIPTQLVLDQLLSSAALIFAPGLLEVLQAATPPAVSFFKSLPGSYDSHWGVYVVVLEKYGSRSRIYVGSATGEYGLRSRFKCYDKKQVLPKKVEDSLNEGFKIVHRGILCSTPRPTAALRPTFRMLILALESTFTFLFWAISSKTRFKIGQSVCPWDVSTFEYDGTCTHSALVEKSFGDHDLTSDQLEAQAAAAAKYGREWHQDWYKRKKAVDPVAWNVKSLKNRKTYRKRKPGKVQETKKKQDTKVKAEKRHYCGICDVACPTPWALKRHLNSATHARNAGDQQSS